MLALRLLRLVTLLKFLNRRAGDSLRGRVAVYVVGSTSLILFVAALAVLDAEREQTEANITTFGDAPRWAMTTVTTVGYGGPLPDHDHRTVRRGRPHAGRHRPARYRHRVARGLDLNRRRSQGARRERRRHQESVLPGARIGWQGASAWQIGSTVPSVPI